MFACRYELDMNLSQLPRASQIPYDGFLRSPNRDALFERANYDRARSRKHRSSMSHPAQIDEEKEGLERLTSEIDSLNVSSKHFLRELFVTVWLLILSSEIYDCDPSTRSTT